MNRIKLLNTPVNVYLRFLPFLLLYFVIIFIFKKDFNVGDEGRYMFFAKNIINGYYSPPAPDINLWNGPGYPLFLVPFIKFGIPLFVVKLFNGIFLYLSLIIFYKTIRVYTSQKVSMIFSYLLALYFPIYESLPFILTECFTWFLVSLTCYFFVKNFKDLVYSWKDIFGVGFVLTFLVMTKLIFGYVVLVLLLLSTLGSVIIKHKFRRIAIKSFVIFFLTFVLMQPYLFYTYQLTGSYFYLSNSGSKSLYTMSTPYDDELGEWLSDRNLYLNPRHQNFVDSLSTLNTLQRDKAYKEKAIYNIKHNPEKYFINWIANIGRMLFAYPFSYRQQSLRTYFGLFPNIFVFVFLSISIILGARHYRRFPIVFLVLFVFFLTYLFGSSLVSAYKRMFYITLPFWFFYMAFVFDHIVEIKIKKEYD